MSTAHTIITVVAAAWIVFSAYATLTKASWVVDNLDDYGVPTTWWPRLATAKAIGALGLLVGLIIPPIGIAATIGVGLYFLAAVVTVIRAGAYSHIPYPMMYLVPVIVAAALGAWAQ
jgi:hypothetical protein